MNTGLDPEVLALDENDYIVPAEYFLPPPEETPAGRLNHLSWDNAAVEMRPHHTSRSARLTKRLREIIQSATSRLGVAHHEGYVPKARLSLTPAAELPEVDRDLDSVQVFGCDPFCILDSEFRHRRSEPFVTPAETPMRSAGFHVHQELSHSGSVPAAVAVLDGLLGLVDVLMNDQLGFTEPSLVRRRKLGYGRAGEFRTRRIEGVTVLEYRTLSPWPLMSPEVVRWVVGVIRAVARQEAATLLDVLSRFPPRGAIVEAINSGDVDEATYLYSITSTIWNDTLGGEHDATRRLLRSATGGYDLGRSGKPADVGLLRRWTARTGARARASTSDTNRR